MFEQWDDQQHYEQLCSGWISPTIGQELSEKTMGFVVNSDYDTFYDFVVSNEKYIPDEYLVIKQYVRASVTGEDTLKLCHDCHSKETYSAYDMAYVVEVKPKTFIRLVEEIKTLELFCEGACNKWIATATPLLNFTNYKVIIEKA